MTHTTPEPMTDEQRKQIFRDAENRMMRDINLSWRNAVVDCANEARDAMWAERLSAQAGQGDHWTEREPVRLKESRAGRVYVAGPMTGLPEFNFPAFNAESASLRAQGLTVLNPAEHGIVEGADWADYLRHDIAGLASCERIHLLPGWSNSKGAKLEMHIAQTLGMTVTHADGAEPISPAGQAGGEPVYTRGDGARPPFEPGPMDARKAAYFMRRFKHEEKLLGPNEQRAIDFVLALLDAPQQQAGGEVVARKLGETVRM